MASPPIRTVMIRRLLVILNLLAGVFSAHSQTGDPNLWSPNGPVNSIVLRDSLLYVGGDFSQVSPVAGRLVRLDSATAGLAPAFPFITGKINCMAKDSLGRIYVGGDFAQVGSYPYRNLFRLDTLGNVDTTFVPDPDGEIFTLSTDSFRLWIGGDFLNINGFNRMRGAAIHVTERQIFVDTQGDSSYILAAAPDTLNYFDPQAQGPIYSLCIDSAGLNVIAGGDFAGIGGFPITYIAKLKPETGQSAGLGNSFWQSSPNANGPVRVVRTYRNRIYLAGDFTAMGLDPRMGLAVIRFDNGMLLTTDSLNQPAYNAGINGPVRDIELIGDKLFIAGHFGIVDGLFRSNIACLDTMLNVQSWIADADKEVYDIQRWGTNTLCFGGNFHTVNGDTAYYLSLVDRNTAAVQNWNPMFDGNVYAIMPASNGKIYAGGTFNGAAGVLRENLCAINVNTRRPTNWSPKVNAPVQTLYADANTLYVAGDFQQINQQLRNRIAAYDLQTLSLNAFNPGVNGLVRAMVSDQSKLYIGGNFTNAGGQNRNNIAAITIANSQATVWNPGCAGTVNKIILDNDWMYLGGFFSQAGGQPRQNLARIHTSTGVIDWNWNCDTDNGVYDMELYNGYLYFGGWFDHAAGQARNHLGAADTLTGALISFDPGVDNYVRSFARWNDDLFIGGAFATVETVTNYPRLANYDLGDDQFDIWAPMPNAMPETMQASQNWLYIGGGFSNAGFAFHPYLAMLSVNFVTGLNETLHTQNSGINLYPNPTADQVFVSVNGLEPGRVCDLAITDLTGRIIFSESSVSGTELSHHRIDISTFPSGLYLCTITENGLVIAADKFIRK